MMTLIAAAVLAAQAPAVPAPAIAQSVHEHHSQMGQPGEHKDKDCCKECCKDMASKHEGHRSGRSEHTGH